MLSFPTLPSLKLPFISDGIRGALGKHVMDAVHFLAIMAECRRKSWLQEWSAELRGYTFLNWQDSLFELAHGSKVATAIICA